jgi:hypothetical protein
MFSQAPTSVSISLILGLVGTFGLFVGARARWYRPIHGLSYGIGLVGAVSYLSFHVVPSYGVWPLSGLVQTFQVDTMAGLATAVHFGCLLAAAVVCALNVPSTPSFIAVNRARLCVRLLVASIAAPLAFLLLSFLSMLSGNGSVLAPLLSSGAKYCIMYGGLLLLIPVGITDLVVGRTPDH